VGYRSRRGRLTDSWKHSGCTHAKSFAVAVQWHPEWKVMSNPFSLPLFCGLRVPPHANTCRDEACRLTDVQQKAFFMVSETPTIFPRPRAFSEVEAIIPGHGPALRAERSCLRAKFAEDEGMRLPESVFLQTVTGDYPPDPAEAMSRRRLISS